jgi:hypothetical protein
MARRYGIAEAIRMAERSKREALKAELKRRRWARAFLKALKAEQKRRTGHKTLCGCEGCVDVVVGALIEVTSNLGCFEIDPSHVVIET